MFRQLVPLDREAHRHLKLAANQPYHFAASEMLIPVVFSEIRHIAREYPIVFPRDGQGVPFALVGSAAGINAHVRDSGHWMGRYIPAHLRRYPFMLGEPDKPDPEGKKRLTILIDEKAPHLGPDKGDPLFDKNGNKSQALAHVEKMLAALHKDFEATKQMVAQLADAGLFVEKPLAVNPKKGSPRQLTGFNVIDMDRLKDPGDETLSGLMRSGALMLAYAHWASLINLQDGWIAHSISQEGQEKTDTPDIEALFGGGEDLFKFDA